MAEADLPVGARQRFPYLTNTSVDTGHIKVVATDALVKYAFV